MEEFGISEGPKPVAWITIPEDMITMAARQRWSDHPYYGKVERQIILTVFEDGTMEADTSNLTSF